MAATEKPVRPLTGWHVLAMFVAFFGVIIAGTLTGEDPLKGWIAGIFGLFVAGIGQEPQYGFERFSYGVRDLAGGIQLVPALVGAFGFAELLTAIKERQAPIKISPFDTVIPKIKDITKATTPFDFEGRLKRWCYKIIK